MYLVLVLQYDGKVFGFAGMEYRRGGGRFGGFGGMC